MRFSELVTPQTIISDIRAGTTPELLAELAGRAAFLTGLDRMALFRALLDGEAVTSTGLGLGVAMPHIRSRMLAAPVALFARLGRPIDYHALDKRPVDVVFLLLGPEPATPGYLKLLICAARALRDPVARDAMRNNFNVATIVAALEGAIVPTAS